MTTLNFPATPASGTTHNAANGLQYTYDGVKWTSQGSYATGIQDIVKLDNIADQFNGSLTTFNLTVNSGAIFPLSAEALTISLGGVIQEPQTAYTINTIAGTITFASAPLDGTKFYGVLQSRLPVNTAAIGTLGDGAVSSEGKLADGVVTNAKVNSAAAIDAAKLSFTQSGTGAAARTVDSKLKDLISVLDYIPETEHAAIRAGNSTYDATNKIQLALSNGKTIYFPNGKYICASGLVITEVGTKLYGEANEKGVANVSKGTGTIIEFTGDTGITTNPKGINKIEFRDMTIRSSTGFTSKYLIEFKAVYSCLFSNMIIQNNGSNSEATGLYMDSDDDNAATHDYAWNNFFDNCLFSCGSNKGHTIDFQGSDSFFNGIYSSGGAGIRTKPGGNNWSNIHTERSYSSGNAGTSSGTYAGFTVFEKDIGANKEGVINVSNLYADIHDIGVKWDITGIGAYTCKFNFNNVVIRNAANTDFLFASSKTSKNITTANIANQTYNDLNDGNAANDYTAATFTSYDHDFVNLDVLKYISNGTNIELNNAAIADNTELTVANVQKDAINARKISFTLKQGSTNLAVTNNNKGNDSQVFEARGATASSGTITNYQTKGTTNEIKYTGTFSGVVIYENGTFKKLHPTNNNLGKDIVNIGKTLDLEVGQYAGNTKNNIPSSATPVAYFGADQSLDNSNNFAGMILSAGPNSNQPTIYAGKNANEANIAATLFLGTNGVQQFSIQGSDGRIKSIPTYSSTAIDSANISVNNAGFFRRQSSSQDYKKDIETIQDSYADKILETRPVWFKAKNVSDGDNPNWGYWGFIAEEVATIDPRLVSYSLTENTINSDGSYEHTTRDTPKPEGVHYTAFIPHLVNLIKRQKTEIENLKTRVTQLEG